MNANLPQAVARWLRGIGLALFAALVASLIALVSGYTAGLRFNFTSSLPLGLYRVVDRPLARGAYVRFCPPRAGAIALALARGYLHAGGVCGEGYRPMLKRVAAVGGERVSVRDDGVWVGQRHLPLSAPLAVDAAGRPMPRLSPLPLPLAPSQLWVMSDTNPYSFDSRYFGAIDRTWVLEVVEPVLTWGPGSLGPGRWCMRFMPYCGVFHH